MLTARREPSFDIICSPPCQTPTTATSSSTKTPSSSSDPARRTPTCGASSTATSPASPTTSTPSAPRSGSRSSCRATQTHTGTRSGTFGRTGYTSVSWTACASAASFSPATPRTSPPRRRPLPPTRPLRRHEMLMLILTAAARWVSTAPSPTLARWPTASRPSTVGAPTRASWTCTATCAAKSSRQSSTRSRRAPCGSSLATRARSCRTTRRTSLASCSPPTPSWRPRRRL